MHDRIFSRRLLEFGIYSAEEKAVMLHEVWAQLMMNQRQYSWVLWRKIVTVFRSNVISIFVNEILIHAATDVCMFYAVRLSGDLSLV
jgi:hypothetical protein